MLFGLISLFTAPLSAVPLIGQPAPLFSLADDTGRAWSLEQHRGKKIVMYFYPADGTPGCTAQACGLRNNYAEFKKAGAVVVGVNYQSVATHKKFKQSQNLPFALLSDVSGDVASRYGASRWWPNLVPKRTTIIIDEQGVIRHILNDVDVSTHMNLVLGYVRNLNS